MKKFLIGLVNVVFILTWIWLFVASFHIETTYLELKVNYEDFPSLVKLILSSGFIVIILICNIVYLFYFYFSRTNLYVESPKQKRYSFFLISNILLIIVILVCFLFPFFNVIGNLGK